MKTEPKKRGRKEKPYQLANGSYVNGLRRRPDGRWVIIATGKMFTEHDEDKALKRFREMSGDGETAAEAYDRLQGRQQLHVSKAQMWKYFADELQARPKWVAEQTGLPSLAFFKSYHAPEKLPSLKEIKQNWTDHARGGKEHRSKVARSWDDFISFTAIKGIDEITPQLALDYQDYIYTEGYKPKTQSHFFANIRAMLNLKHTKALAIEAVGKALDCLALMTPNGNTNNRDAKPISVADWKELLKVAEGDNRAMVLLMLNAALYAGEVVTVEWDEIKDNGTYVSRRKKTGEFIRVATLWPETLAALKAIKRQGPNVFRSNMGTQLSKFSAFERFRALRDKAKISVTPSHLRDGAYTAAVGANVSTALCNLLIGQATGTSMGDNYILAAPEMVKPACDAVYARYMK